MKLNHLDLPVRDINAARHFFETHFGLSYFYQGIGLVVLKDDVGFVLTLSSLPADAELNFPSGFHIGFILEREDSLRETYARLVAAGVNIVYPIAQLGGALTFQCQALGILLIEVSWRP
jgi:catechol 2,3-dioxygenase-like lactoylglutathione lyase family enzyme